MISLLVDPSIQYDATVDILASVKDGTSGKTTVLGKCNWVNYNTCRVIVSTWELTLNASPSLSYFVKGLPAKSLEGNKYVTQPYCSLVETKSESEWTVSQTGICANKITCNTTTGFCNCPGGTTTPGDTCNGSLPVLSCNLSCQTGFVANESCKDCVCMNGLKCPNGQVVRPDCSGCYTPCSLTCQNGTFPDDQCTKCDCPADSSFIGKECETCSLTCMNKGTIPKQCTSCTCPRVGYTGKNCQCHTIGFALTWSIVPENILTAFHQDSQAASTSPQLFAYIRTQLFAQPAANKEETLFKKFSLISIELIDSDTDVSAQMLRINGNITDNCATSLETLNYRDLKSRWVSFLNSLPESGMEVDKVKTNVSNVEFKFPDLRCDELLDPECDGVDDNGAIICGSVFALILSVVAFINLF
jgi:hypothetical protein